MLLVKQIAIFWCMVLISLLKGAAVTYELNGGRFGDNLSAYIHAKWISYTYGIPLIYKPFPYSNALRLHYLEKRIKAPKKKIVLQKNFQIDKDKDILYVVPYFSEFKYEHALPTNRQWIYFKVDWHNKEFVQLIRSLIKPHDAHLSLIKPPAHKISVALHVRRGTDYDGELLLETENPEDNIGKYTDYHTPLKFLPIQFYIHQIKKIFYHYKQPLYVYVFTDELHPEILIERLKASLQEFPMIEIDYKPRSKHYSKYFLEDFFSLLEFNCIIHPLSNFSFIASKLTDYMIQIYPIGFHWEGLTAVIDKVKMQGKRIKKI